MSLQQDLYRWLEEPEKSPFSYWLNVTIYILIIVSVILLMLSTVDDYQLRYGDWFDVANHLIMSFFTLEYVARVYASGHLDRFKGLKGKLNYMKRPFAIIDLLAILPYILSFFSVDSVFIRALRLLRVFRLFRMRKYTVFATILRNIFLSKKEEFIVLLFYTFIIIVLLSFVIFRIEHDAQPEVFTNVIQTLWWAVATLTTVGYGDMYPITASGQLVTSFISIIGIAFVAIPGGIFASEFINEFAKSKSEVQEDENMCFRCGSSELELIIGPMICLHGQEVDLSKMKHCKSCGLYWLTDNSG